MAWSNDKVRYCCLGVLLLLAFSCAGARLYARFGVDPVVQPHVSFLTYAAIFSMAAFVVVFVGDNRQNHFITGFGAIALIILAIVYVTLIFVHWNKKDLTGGIQQVEEAWERKNMETIQTQYECCGKASAHDYIVINQQIPSSCYKNYAINDSRSIFQEGCSTKVNNNYRENMHKLTLMLWVIVFTQILAIPAAIILTIDIRNKKRRMQF